MSQNIMKMVVGPKIWKSIPRELKQRSSLKTFKNLSNYRNPSGWVKLT